MAVFGHPSGSSVDSYAGFGWWGWMLGFGHRLRKRLAGWWLSLLRLCPGHVPLWWQHRRGLAWPDPID
jgi:hypothetical protein